jgi:type I restriction enzyme, S subunit
MIANLKPYPAMKDSGVPWLGEVPEHWKVRPNRALFTEIKERDHPDEQMLSVTITRGVIPQQSLLADSLKKDSSNLDKSAYKLVRAGDIAYNKMRAWQGAVGTSTYRGIVSPAYVVQHPRDGVGSRYFHYLFRTPAFAKEAERWSYGITSDMWSLRPEHFRLIYSCLPPVAEQAAIVRFLDHADRRIRRYIRAKQKLIKLLEEQKQAIIHRAVTSGIDPDVRLKPSSVEWLGDVPEHWDVRRILGVFRERKETGQPNWPILVVSIAQGVTKGDEFDEDGRPKRLIEDKTLYKVAHKGDIAYNMMRMWQGAVGVVPENGLVSPAYVVAQPQPQINSEYFALLFRTEACKGDTVSRSRGIVDDRNRLYWDGFKGLRVPVPPYNEQSLIAAFVAGETKAINKSIERVNREISLLREFRTRLIADVVTGKVDVREAAARLPEEVEETETADEIEERAEGKEEISDAGLDGDSEEAVDAG